MTSYIPRGSCINKLVYSLILQFLEISLGFSALVTAYCSFMLSFSVISVGAHRYLLKANCPYR